MTTSTMPIGQIKMKATAYCSVCSCSTKRNLSEFVFTNTPEHIEEIKAKVLARANAEYTCKICKSIQKIN